MEDNNNRRMRKNTIESLRDRGALTRDGAEWLTAALDPFHDFEHPLAGYPDATVSQTVMSVYSYDLAVAKPAHVVGTWDAHIFTLPTASQNDFSLATLDAAWQVAQTANPATDWRASTLNVYSVGAGEKLIPDVTPQQYGGGILPPLGSEDLSMGVSRVVAMGFEVHNTTSDLYKQGAVTTYRMPINNGDFTMCLEKRPMVSKNLVHGQMFAQPPRTLADALRLKGSRTWEAKDGVYATCMQSSVVNPLTQLTPNTVALVAATDPGVADSAWVSEQGAVLGDMLLYVPNPTKTMPFDITGAMFTGLSAETTLNVKLRVYVERAPGWNSPNLAPLASPSAGYDVKALELYAQIINCLPPAVKVDENAFGDWWRSVLSVANHVVGPITDIVSTFVPGARLVGNAAQKVLGQFNTKQNISTQVADAVERKETRPQQQQPPRRRRNAIVVVPQGRNQARRPGTRIRK